MTFSAGMMQTAANEAGADEGRELQRKQPPKETGVQKQLNDRKRAGQKPTMISIREREKLDIVKTKGHGDEQN